MPVDVSDDEVPAPLVSFEMRGEVRAARGHVEGLLHQLTTPWPVMDARTCSSREANENASELVIQPAKRCDTVYI